MRKGTHATNFSGRCNEPGDAPAPGSARHAVGPSPLSPEDSFAFIEEDALKVHAQ
jgi:hypothetical protein